MAPKPNIGFNYIPKWTMAGILYNGEDGLPHFSSRTGQTHTVLLPQGISHPISICSSSNGLVACHNPKSNIYYIGNPEYQDSYIALPPTPRQHNAHSTHVVLATEFSALPAYHLICAIRVDRHPIRYNFDTYSSLIGRWLSYEGIDVGGHILHNTGVSCGFFAYWLTEVPRFVIRFDVYNPQVRWKHFPAHAHQAGLGTRFQLGTVRNQLGLISVDTSLTPKITLYLLQEDFPVPWQRYTYALPILNPNLLPVWILNPNTLPVSPIRFESFKFEVFFRFNGRLIIWETSIDEPRTIRVANLNAVGAGAADGFAHIISPYRPVHFRKLRIQ